MTGAPTLDADLRRAAANSGHKIALVFGTRHLTYAEFDRAVDGVTNGLRELGVVRGDRVAVVLRNSIEAAVSIYGILRAGAAFTALNPTVKHDKLSFLLRHSGAVAAVCDAAMVPALTQAAAGVPTFRNVISVAEHRDAAATLEELANGPCAQASTALDVDLASIIYTSGSTGIPKGVTFLHRNMCFVADSIIRYLELREEERILLVLPISHTYGLYHLLMAVRLGATIVLHAGMAFPSAVVDALEHERITMLPGVPTVWHILTSLQGLAERQLPDLRILTNAGASLAVDRLAAVRATFPRARFFSMYGQTECKRACYLPPEQLEGRPGSVGVAIPGTEVWVARPDGTEALAGETGELMIRGDHVMQGYWNDPAATARRLVPGRWPGDRVLRSGDLFFRDEAGYLYFVARRDEIIKSRGEKVAPKEVEDVLSTAPGVREVAVVGEDHALLGQAVVAHVSPFEGVALDPLTLRRHCAAALEDFMVPTRVEIHHELPKLDNGKLDKRALT
jgi:long-chain acyl-CoA synthetase